MSHYQFLPLGLSLSITFLSLTPVQAQLLPDNTLENERSVVNSINSLEDRIDGGAIRGSNLFHSFQEFNVNNGRSVYFSNPVNIQNILTRITGNNPSQINGKLGVDGNANLFLINPNGIVFGKDASLDINGSFVGSSANSINFADGKQFSAVSPGDKALLTISTPIGLGMGNNPGDIKVEGEGHRLSNSRFGIPFTDNGTKALEINPGKTLALIGGDIFIEGGSLKTNSGTIELGSVASGNVDLKFNTHNVEFDYSQVEKFKDIHLSNQSSLQLYNRPQDLENLPGLNNSGSIRLQGKQISLRDASIIFADKQTALSLGDMVINAAESFTISGANLKETQFSSLRSQTLFTGEGGGIEINTKRLAIENAGAISAYNFSSNSGGNIDITASESIDMKGYSPQRVFVNFLITNTFASGRGGDINILTGKMITKDGATISSSTFSQGNAGNLAIDASESVELYGVNPVTLQNTLLTSLTFGSGSGGSLIINTSNLIIKDGARVDASTIGRGNAGNITINASDSVEITGYSSDSPPEPSLITSSADIADQNLQRLFGFPLILEGDSGTVTINTNILDITDGALIAVKNDGSGDAGIISIKSNTINISDRANISATTALGEGGDIVLKTQDFFLRNNSNISATALKGSGGNININAQVLAALENSDITANSEGSFGGKVQINSQGIFGTQFREFLTPQSDITANSALGTEFNGVVDINNLAIAPNPGLVELSQSLIDSDQRIVAGCSIGGNNKFVVTGNGGLPQNPDGVLATNNPYVDLVDLLPNSINQSLDIKSENTHNTQQEIVEAKGWIVNSEGKIVLVAKSPKFNNQLTNISPMVPGTSCAKLES